MSSTFWVQCSINPHQNPIIGRPLSIIRYNVCSKLYTLPDFHVADDCCWHLIIIIIIIIIVNPHQNLIIGRSLSIIRHNICSKLYTVPDFHAADDCCWPLIIIITRPKPAYGRQGQAGSWGQDTDEVSTFLVFLTSHFAPATLSSDLTNLGPLMTMKIHLETLKNHGNQPKTINQKNHDLP